MTLPPTIRIVSSSTAISAPTPMQRAQQLLTPPSLPPSRVVLQTGSATQSGTRQQQEQQQSPPLQPSQVAQQPSPTAQSSTDHQQQKQSQWHPPYNHNFHPTLGFRKDFEARQRAAGTQKDTKVTMIINSTGKPMNASSPTQTDVTTSPDISVDGSEVNGLASNVRTTPNQGTSPSHRPVAILPRPNSGGTSSVVPHQRGVGVVEPSNKSIDVETKYKVVTVQGYKLELPVLDEKTFDDGQPFPNVTADVGCQFGIQDDELNDVDVLCGRGGMTNAHPGNIHFRHLVNYYRLHYGSVKKCYKSNITKIIVTIIRNRYGRFLKKSEKDGLWYEVGDIVARDKTAQTLREGLARMVRTSLIKTHKHRQSNNGNISTPTSVSAKLSEQAQVRMVVEQARKRWEADEEKKTEQEFSPKRSIATAFSPAVATPAKRARGAQAFADT